MKSFRVDGLLLEPLVKAHADSLFTVLEDPEIYAYLGFAPPESAEQLGSMYERVEARRKLESSERWLDWAIVLRPGVCIGYVQATVFERTSAWIAYVLGRAYWNHGYGRTAVAALIDHLGAEYGCNKFLGRVHRANARSVHLLHSLGFREADAQDAARHPVSATEVLLVKERGAEMRPDPSVEARANAIGPAAPRTSVRTDNGPLSSGAEPDAEPIA